MGLLWTSDQPYTETTQHSQQTDRQTSTLSAGLEPAIPGSELPQTHALDRAATYVGYFGGSLRDVLRKEAAVWHVEVVFFQPHSVS